MIDITVFLRDLEVLISDQVQHVVSNAANCPVGGSPEWDELLRCYRVEKMSASARRERIFELGLLRGALPEEMCGALAEVGTRGRQALRHLESHFTDVIEADHRLQNRLARLHQYLDQLSALEETPVVRVGMPSMRPAMMG
ncbi:MAG: hypothetical protein ABI333_20070 [bacterium]